MSICVEEKTKIYVVAPATIATGGPELLHQLAFSLRQINIDAYMYYIPSKVQNPVHPAYKSYGNPFVRSIDDRHYHILIVPETFKTMKLLQCYRKIQKVIWWLSVDNFYQSMFETASVKGIWVQLINKLFKLVGFIPKYDLAEESLKFFQTYELNKDRNIKASILHLVQSNYARNHLILKGILPERIKYLSDYLHDDFLSFDYTKHVHNKENIVLYNPKKGYKFTKSLILNARHIKFIPIQNMDREDVITVMLKAKVYIDFGNHPGKDRMTREAAALGCIIITSKKGSAGNSKDVPISNRYKFIDRQENIQEIVALIEDCLLNYDKHIENFFAYRKKIFLEKQIFYNDLKEVFKGSF